MGIDRTKWPQHSVRAVDKWILSADLGQSTDPTALCALNHRVVPLDEWKQDDKAEVWRQGKTEHFDVRHLQRLPLGMPYPEQVQHVANVLARPPLTSAKFVVDETGVGRAVADIFDRAGLKPDRVTITAGLETTQHGAYSWHVSKTQLISALDARLHTGELKIAAELSEAGALQEELLDSRRKVSEAGRATWSARVGAHDDLVLAVAIALWRALHGPGAWSSRPLPF
jgi:hypothetical protein